MALDLEAIRTALAAQIKANVSRKVNVYGGYVPASPSPPAVLIVPSSDVYVSFHESFSRTGMALVNFRVTVAVPPGPDVDGQITLDEFLSAGAGLPNSILDAIDADLTLGGAAATCFVESVEYLGRINLSELNDQQVQADAAALLLAVRTQRA